MMTNISEVNKVLAGIQPPTIKSWLDWKWDIETAISNSNIWQDIMTLDAQGNYLMAPVPTNLQQVTATEQGAIQAFKEKSQHACQWIKRAAGCHNDKFMRPHMATNLPVDMWHTLKAQFAPKGVSKCISLFSTLTKLLKMQDEKWITYFHHQDDLAMCFLILFPATMPMTVNESDCIRGTALVYRDLQRQNKPLDELASPPSK